MTDTDKRIDQVLGSVGAARVVQGWIDAYQRDDHLPERAAMRLAVDLVSHCSPWHIAAPDQTWRRRDPAGACAEYPSLLRVMEVRPNGASGSADTAAVLFADAEFDPWRPIGWMEMDDLALFYAIEDWPNPRVPRIVDDGIHITTDGVHVDAP
ncbi:hypothetical protein [Embleya sp. NBC_00896]|uniref:hypothetical protein n=1 Tax=Embleya sp. NBC_00896 TaxID=2975961 RepID=UPI002F9120B9|nr:hypothetical protein OG928_48180 [Embleya sp. NBC_00896]